MKNQYLLILGATVLAPVLFSGCGSTAAGSSNYTTIPLKEYKYVPASIPSGTEITILGYSGGKAGKKGDVYYSQFIGTESGTGDTVRILAAWIAVPSDTGTIPVFTPVSMFDGRKGVREAAFLIPDSNDLTTMKLGASLVEDADDTAKLNHVLANTNAPINEYVILQDDVPLFKRNYKTAIGVMNFKQQPW